jgi:uncharacterized lipoprotein NlpE involved in copper resistance
MKKLTLILSACVILSLIGCNNIKVAQRSYARALKNGLKVIVDSDTIKITSIDSIPYIINDTIVWQKFTVTKDTVIFYKNIYIPKTKWQTRIEYRYKTKVLKQNVLKYKYIYKTEKKQKSKTNWMLFFWGFISGIALFFILRLIDKIYNPFK